MTAIKFGMFFVLFLGGIAFPPVFVLLIALAIWEFYGERRS